eukprot:6153187-Pyramimonas_sp.AAC.1
MKRLRTRPSWQVVACPRGTQRPHEPPGGPSPARDVGQCTDNNQNKTKHSTPDPRASGCR